MSTERHRAVIFDLDGVLTDTAEFHYLAWQQLADEEGIAFDRAANEELRGVSRRDSLLRLLGDRSVDDAAFEEMMARKNGYYLEYLQEMTPRDALEGAASLVVDAKRRGLQVAIGSSSKNAEFVLDALGMTSLFDAVADGHSVEHAKPAPDLFLAAAEMLGEDPAACIVVEDAGSGVDAALAAGMTAIGVGPHERVGHAHHRFDSTADVDLDAVLEPSEQRLGGGPLLQSGWVLVDDHHDPEQVAQVATTHLTANGYLGYRGTLPEWDASATVGCTVTDTWDKADGKWQELCNVPNALFAQWEADGETVGVSADRTLSNRDRLERRLDIRYGRQHRVFTPATGPVTRLVDERFASMDDLHLVAQRQRIFAPPGTRLTLRTGIDGRVWSLNGDHFAEVRPQAHEDVLVVGLTTVERGLEIAVAHAVRLSGATPAGEQLVEEDRTLLRVWEVDVGERGVVVVDQVMAVFSGNDVDAPESVARERARGAVEAGYDTLLVRHTAAWDRRWARIDVRIEGDALAQTLLRYNLYHNVIATPMHTDHLPIGARGLSCQAYQGAAFWDQEVFNLPMWVHTFPEVARNLLTYRARTLDGARRKAARLGFAGAFYAWISGDTGDELCPDFFFTDVLTDRPIRNHFNDWQIHISPDVAVTAVGYARVTGDRDFMAEHGAEIVFEVARFLASRVHFRPADGAYHLVRLLGPDEYHENVDDNVFTLEQARVTLAEAVDLWDELASDDAPTLARLRASLGLTEDERELWADIAERLVRVEAAPETGLIEQFAGYFSLEDVTPAQLRGRLQHPDEYWGWPNGVAVHTQVTKQADLVQLFVNQPERYDEATIVANVDYYLPRTQHGSSLSRPMYALVCARLDRLDEAYELFLRAATVDLLADAHVAPGGTFIGGIHVAACGAIWQVAVLGFGGVHVREDVVEIAPRLPEGWQRLSFGLAVRGGWLEVSAGPSQVTVRAAETNPDTLAVVLHGEQVAIAPGQEHRVAR